MSCKRFTWLLCIFVVAAGHSDSASIPGPDPKFTDYSLEDDDLESSEIVQVQEDTKPAAVDLGALLDGGQDAMVTLVAGDTRLVVHKAVLTARSHVFAAALHPDTLEAGSSHIVIQDMEGPVLRQLVAYLYTLQVPQLPSTATQLLVAADRYGVSALREECERQVAAQLSVENAAAVAVFAVKHSYTGLGQAAITFMRDHLLQVMATKGWADAMRSYTDELIRVSQLLSDPQVENGSGSTSTTELPTDLSRCSWNPTKSAPATAARRTATPDSDGDSLLRCLSPEKKGNQLIEAAKENNVEEMKALIAVGADLQMLGDSQRGWDKWTALHWAAWEGNVEAVKTLLEAGAEVNVRSLVQATPLQVAAWNGQLPVVRLLLAACADLNTQNKWGYTPLHEAAKHGHSEVVAALLGAGADKEVTTEAGTTALEFAIEGSHSSVVNLLRSS